MTDRTKPQLNRSWLLLLTFAICGPALAAYRLDYPLACAAGIIALMMLKARLVVFDFLGMRAAQSITRNALLVWPALFASLAIAKAVIFAFHPAG